MVDKLIQKIGKVGRFLTLKRLFQLGVFVLIGGGVVLAILAGGGDMAVLNPQGIIANKERDLMVFTTLLGLVVVIPVFVMLFSFAWKYREGNPKKTKYTPEVGGNRVIETLWWGIPTLIIAILGVVTWVSTHDLDPYKKLTSDNQAVKIQVVALQWKWLFIYPDQGIATVNEVRFPEKTPVDFEITADAPMSAFWIPSLGSQTYAMNGMTSQLSLMADHTGEFQGSNTNINGKGYARMTFKAIAMEASEFKHWATLVKTQSHSQGYHLDWDAYDKLAKPSEGLVSYYHLHDTDLFNQILAKYMGHGGHTMDMSSDSNSGEIDHMYMEGMDH